MHPYGSEVTIIRCTELEDSPPGAAAGVAAGTTVVAVPFHVRLPDSDGPSSVRRTNPRLALADSADRAGGEGEAEEVLWVIRIGHEVDLLAQRGATHVLVGLLLLDQETRVGTLRVQGVGGDGDPGQVEGRQQLDSTQLGTARSLHSNRGRSLGAAEVGASVHTLLRVAAVTGGAGNSPTACS